MKFIAILFITFTPWLSLFANDNTNDSSFIKSCIRRIEADIEREISATKKDSINVYFIPSYRVVLNTNKKGINNKIDYKIDTMNGYGIVINKYTNEILTIADKTYKFISYYADYHSDDSNNLYNVKFKFMLDKALLNEKICELQLMNENDYQRVLFSKKKIIRALTMLIQIMYFMINWIP